MAAATWGQEVWGANVWGGEYRRGTGSSLPPTNNNPASAQSTSTYDSIEAQSARIYGLDMQFNNSNVIGLDGDYQLLEGKAALKQAILHRLMTRPGEFRLRPDYGAGIPDYVKKPSTASTVAELTTAIKVQLAKEPRVGKVESVSISKTATSLVVKVNVIANGEPLELTATAEGA